IHPRLAHLLQNDGPMPRLNIVGCGFFVFEKIVCGFDGIRAATELRNTPSRMNSHRLCDLFNARNTPDVRQLCPCKLFFRPLLWFWVYTNSHCLTPHLSLVKLLYVTMPQGEFWVMTSPEPWCSSLITKMGSNHTPLGMLPHTARRTIMDPTTTFCPYRYSPARGQIGRDNIGIHARKEQRFICHQFQKTFSATTGTVFYRLRTREHRHF